MCCKTGRNTIQVYVLIEKKCPSFEGYSLLCTLYIFAGWLRLVMNSWQTYGFTGTVAGDSLFSARIPSMDTHWATKCHSGGKKVHSPTGSRTQDLSHTVRAVLPLSYRTTRTTCDNFPLLKITTRTLTFRDQTAEVTNCADVPLFLHATSSGLSLTATFFLRRFLAFCCFKWYLASVSSLGANCVFTQIIPPKHAE